MVWLVSSESPPSLVEHSTNSKYRSAKMAGPIGSSPNEWSPAASSLNFSQSIGGHNSAAELGRDNVNSTVESDSKAKDAREAIDFAGKSFKVEWIKV